MPDKIHVKTMGCAANFAESEMMKGLLQKAQFEITENEKDSDLIVINICTVKGDAHALREIRKIKEQFPNKKIVVAGCITPTIAKPINELVPNASLITTHNIHQIAPVVEETFNQNPIQVFEKKPQPKVNLPRVRKNPLIGIIPIQSGCTSHCTFCSTKLVKGDNVSYAPDLIVKEIEQSIKEGVKEFWLTGQDTSCYGLDIGLSLPKLLNMIVKVPGDFFVRVGMANPKHIKEYTQELIEVYKNPKIFKFIHIPVQAGNDEVLKRMARRYTVAEYKEIVKEFKNAFPEITISTDIIVGFAGETNEQFMDTIKLVKETEPDVINISRFASRPGTVAYRLKDNDGETKKQRSRYLTTVYEYISWERNKKWIGWQGPIVIDELGKNNTLVGRNYAYKPVVVQGDFKLGDIVNVKIEKATSYDLRAKIL
jgi:threonylcarbamoyladenosine tRNA methylthiotransferase CDKAL1